MPLPVLPPGFRLRPVEPAADPFVRARFAARHDPEDGALFWARREDRMDCAIVFVPESGAAAVLAVAPVVMLALADALGALAAPVVSLRLGWPDRLLVNGALAGGLRAAWEPGWLVVALTVAVLPDPLVEPGRRPDRTTLHDEGCGDIAADALLESFTRHLLSWLHRWNEEGLAPVRAAWLKHAEGARFEEAELADALRSATWRL